MMSQPNIKLPKQSYQPLNDLPEEPVLIIEANRRSLWSDMQKLWHYRDLLFVLTFRDIKVRYKQTILGVLWVVVQPVFMMTFFTLIFGLLAGMPSDGVPYSIFAFTGLLPWTFFSNAVSSSANSLVGNSSLITKVYFPRIIIPMASVGAVLIDFGISFGLLIVLMFYHNIGFSVNLLMLPPLAFLTVLAALSFGTWLSALNVKYRDIRHALPFILQLGVFTTPIIYPTTLIPEKWRWLLNLNPLTGIIEGFRSAIFSKPFNFTDLGISTVIVIILFLYSTRVFRRIERNFADIV